MISGTGNSMIYTPDEIFNPTTANMVLQSMGAYASALRLDYKDAVDKEEQFMKDYGSFISPIEADQETYYNATLGGINELYNNASKQGVDLLRSQQGRAIIQRFLMSRPYGELAKIRLSAQNAQEFIKNRDELKRAGLYSAEMDAWENPISVDNWNTQQNGVWQSTSPSQYKTYDLMLKPIVDQLNSSKQYIGNRGGYRLYGVSDDRIEDSLNANMDDLLSQPSMRYLASTLGGDKNKLKQVLFERIKSKMEEDEKIDEVKFKNAELNLKRQELAILREKANADNLLKRSKALGLNSDGSYSYKAKNVYDALTNLGWVEQYGPDGTYYSPMEVQISGLDNYISSKINNTIIYSKRLGKNVKYSELNDKEKKSLSNSENLRRIAADARNEYLMSPLRMKMLQYIDDKKGYASTASLALATADDANQWYADFTDTQLRKDKNKNIIGVNTSTSAMKNNLLSIEEVTARSGILRKGSKKIGGTTFSKFNNTRNNIKYIKASNEGNTDGMIMQYEPRTGTYHKYRRVTGYDDNNNIVAEMWFECDKPHDLKSSRANGYDSRGVKNAGGSQKQIESALDIMS